MSPKLTDSRLLGPSIRTPTCLCLIYCSPLRLLPLFDAFYIFSASERFILCFTLFFWSCCLVKKISGIRIPCKVIMKCKRDTEKSGLSGSSSVLIIFIFSSVSFMFSFLCVLLGNKSVTVRLFVVTVCICVSDFDGASGLWPESWFFFSFPPDEIMQQEIRPLLAVDIIEQLHRQFALLSGTSGIPLVFGLDPVSFSWWIKNLVSDYGHYLWCNICGSCAPI